MSDRAGMKTIVGIGGKNMKMTRGLMNVVQIEKITERKRAIINIVGD